MCFFFLVSVIGGVVVVTVGYVYVYVIWKSTWSKELIYFFEFQFCICKKLFKSEAQAHRHIDHMKMNVSSIAKNKYVFDR